MKLRDLSEALLRVASQRLALHPGLLAAFQIELATKLHFYGALAELGERLDMQASLSRLTGDRADGADPTPHLVAMVDAWTKRHPAASTVQPLLGWHQEAAPAAPVKETADQRRARVLRAFEAAGLELPADDFATLPRGIGAVAQSLGMFRQAVSRDLKHIILKRKQAQAGQRQQNGNMFPR